jgi:hypothetical protein
MSSNDRGLRREDFVYAGSDGRILVHAVSEVMSLVCGASEGKFQAHDVARCGFQWYTLSEFAWENPICLEGRMVVMPSTESENGKEVQVQSNEYMRKGDMSEDKGKGECRAKSG